jgi:hypothetical protein
LEILYVHKYGYNTELQTNETKPRHPTAARLSPRVLYYYVTGKPELCNSTHGWKTFFGWDLVPEVQYPILIFSLFILTRWWSRIYSKMAEIVQKQQQAHGVYENTNGMPMANGKNLHMEVSACCPFLAL